MGDFLPPEGVHLRVVYVTSEEKETKYPEAKRTEDFQTTDPWVTVTAHAIKL